MEVAQYGDTEINATELKTTVDRLRQCDKDKNKCPLEEQFEVSRKKRINNFENNVSIF